MTLCCPPETKPYPPWFYRGQRFSGQYGERFLNTFSTSFRTLFCCLFKRHKLLFFIEPKDRQEKEDIYFIYLTSTESTDLLIALPVYIFVYLYTHFSLPISCLKHLNSQLFFPFLLHLFH